MLKRVQREAGARSPVNRIWAAWMNQMPCSITSRARAVGSKPRTAVPCDVLHHTDAPLHQGVRSCQLSSFLSLQQLAAEVARLRRKLNSSSGGLIGPGEGLHMQRSSDAQGTRYVREQSSGWAHPISAKHTSAAANISSTRRMCTDLSRELPFRWKAKRMPSTRNAEPRTPCTCRQLLLRSPSSHNNIVCAWSHLLQPERAHATTCQMQGLIHNLAVHNGPCPRLMKHALHGHSVQELHELATEHGPSCHVRPTSSFL